MTTLFFSCGTSNILSVNAPEEKTTIATNGEEPSWKGEIPPGFGKGDFTLLVVKTMTKSFDQHLEKHFSELYTGKYKIITPQEFEDGTYIDHFIYPYAFSAATHGFGNPRERATGLLWPYILDRKENERYARKGTGNGYSPMIKDYVKKMEKARQEKE